MFEFKKNPEMNGLDIVHVWNDQPFLLNDEKPATFVIFIPQNISFNFHIVIVW